jgi:PTH2 family peptidyl-tRNA hydrolase
MQTKQVIVWRNDLKCRTGKKMGQAGHAVLALFEKQIYENIDENGFVKFRLTPEQIAWRKSQWRKIVLQVNSEEELLTIYEYAKKQGISAELIVDAGLTEWDEPTKTCVALGPDYDERIDQVTGENGPLGKLKLM